MYYLNLFGFTVS